MICTRLSITKGKKEHLIVMPGTQWDITGRAIHAAGQYWIDISKKGDKEEWVNLAHVSHMKEIWGYVSE